VHATEIARTSASCDHTWRERGKNGYAAFRIFKNPWQIRASGNKVQLWPSYAVLSEDFCAQKSCHKIHVDFADNKGIFCLFFAFCFTISYNLNVLYYRNLRSCNTSFWIFNR